jgi:L-histidine N-alpha-methyltransferase
MPVKVLDLEPAFCDAEQEILGGLNQPQKQISPKYFYDDAGSRLFDEICTQPEYYPTRTELGIMQDHIGDIARLVGSQASVIEFGSGSSLKTRLLLEYLPELAAYVPVEISRETLVTTAEELAADFPDIEVLPVCADFTQPFRLPTPKIMPRRNLVFFPGSTIGNLDADKAASLLQVMREEAKDDGALLIGVDLVQPPEILEPAYNDAAGVTADFNLNMLERLNREYDANFSLPAFQHKAIYDADNSRIEMRLVSLQKQRVRVAGESFDLNKGEYIVTEHSHKYSLDQFESMANAAGFEVQEVWTDEKKLFSVQYLKAA